MVIRHIHKNGKNDYSIVIITIIVIVYTGNKMFHENEYRAILNYGKNKYITILQKFLMNGCCTPRAITHS